MVRFETPNSAYRYAKLIVLALNILYKAFIESGEPITKKVFLKKYPLPKVKNQKSWKVEITYVP